MKKQNIAIIVLCSLIISNLSACNFNFNFNSSSSATPSVAIDESYSITNAYTASEKNHYMDLNVKIPKIEYSGVKTDTFIDSVNKQMNDSLTELVNKAVKNAKETYEVYLDTAKTNIIQERDNKLVALKNKYKSILGSDEVSAIAGVMNTPLDFAKEDDVLEIRSTEYTVYDTNATNSEIKFGEVHINTVDPNDIANSIDKDKDRPPKDKAPRDKPMPKPDGKKEVDGFTGSEEIIPGPHNKKIIIVESTAKDSSNITQTTATIQGLSPKDTYLKESSIAPSETTTKDNPDIATVSITTTEIGYAKVDEDKITTTNVKITVATTNDVSYTEIEKETNTDLIIKNDLELENNSKNLTYDDFYKELNEIYKIKVPSRNDLTKSYIPTYIYCDFDVKCLDDKYISLYIELTETRATENVKRYFFNLDLNNKKELKLQDVLGSDYKKICVDAINNDISTWTADEKSVLLKGYNVEAIINENTPFFIDNKHRIVVDIDKLAISVGAAGYLEFIVKK